jgi:hypothetical protein
MGSSTADRPASAAVAVAGPPQLKMARLESDRLERDQA